MNQSSFDVYSKVQDVKINIDGIEGLSDSLNISLRIPIQLELRVPRYRVGFNINQVQSQLKLQNSEIVLSEINQMCDISVEEGKGRNEPYTPSISLTFPLEYKAINAIQTIRTDDAKFTLELSLQIEARQLIKHDESGKIWGYMGTSIKKIFPINFSIPRSNWVEKIYPSFRLPGFKIIEIPLYHKDLKEAYENIISEFNKAEKYFNQADYNMCIGHCRSTLDALTRNLKKIKEGVNSESNFEWLKNINNDTLKWIDNMNKNSSAITSKPHHAGFDKEFSRQEAQSIYLVVLGLVNFVGHIAK